MGGRTYVVDDVMAIKPKFLASIGYQISAEGARAELRYKICGERQRHNKIKDCTAYNNQRVYCKK